MLFDAEEGGFSKYCGYSNWRPEVITSDLGSTWSYTGEGLRNTLAAAYFSTALICFMTSWKRIN
jgi:hypothetical protein